MVCVTLMTSHPKWWHSAAADQVEVNLKLLFGHLTVNNTRNGTN